MDSASAAAVVASCSDRSPGWFFCDKGNAISPFHGQLPSMSFDFVIKSGNDSGENGNDARSGGSAPVAGLLHILRSRQACLVPLMAGFEISRAEPILHQECERRR